MTEDDTFSVLKRVPFEDAVPLIQQHALTFESKYHSDSIEYADELAPYLDEYARKIGWSIHDFCYRAKDTDLSGKLRWTTEAYSALMSYYDQH